MLKHLHEAFPMPPLTMEQSFSHIPSHSNISQVMTTQLDAEPYYPSVERSIIEVREMIKIVHTMMANPALCSSADLPETLAALERTLLFTELAVAAYRHTRLARSLGRAMAVGLENCRQLLQELLKNLSTYQYMLSEAVLYFIRRYVCRKWGEGGTADMLDFKLRDCHRSFAACLLALGR